MRWNCPFSSIRMEKRESCLSRQFQSADGVVAAVGASFEWETHQSFPYSLLPWGRDCLETVCARRVQTRDAAGTKSRRRTESHCWLHCQEERMMTRCRWCWCSHDISPPSRRRKTAGPDVHHWILSEKIRLMKSHRFLRSIWKFRQKRGIKNQSHYYIRRL